MEGNLEIKASEIYPEVEQLASENKAIKKMLKLTDKLVSKVNSRMNAERDVLRTKIDSSFSKNSDSISSFITSVNGDLDKFKKRYEAMHGDLVRRILVNMESRLFNVEIFNQAILTMMMKKIYHIEGLLLKDGQEQLNYDQYVEESAKQHEQIMQSIVNDFNKKMNEIPEEKEEDVLEKKE